MRGLIIGGGFGSIIVREKSSKSLELGELLVAEKGDAKLIVQVIDLIYGSQLSQQNLELMSGLRLEEDEELKKKKLEEEEELQMRRVQRQEVPEEEEILTKRSRK